MEKMFQIIARELKVRKNQVQAAVELLDGGNTVPFIARYRKEATGELKDEQLRTIEERLAYLRNLEARREEIINSITEQDKMTDELLQAINKAEILQELEDLYMPYKRKKRTRAMMAREKGLEPLAMIMIEGKTSGTVEEYAKEYLNEEVETVEDAIQGASDIIAEIVSDRADFRTSLRELMHREARISCELIQVKESDASKKSPNEIKEIEELREKYLAYEKYNKLVKYAQSHNILAINRGEKEGALKVLITVPDEKYVQAMFSEYKRDDSIFNEIVYAAIEDSYKRLIFPALEREIRNELTEKADEQAIKVFGINLKNLLLQPPLAGHVIMGLDPGYRTGCKMAIIDSQGTVLDYGAYYLTMSKKAANEAQKALAEKIRKYNVSLISIGNGTASYETEQFASKMIEEENLDCHYIITNEAGASVYSASKLAIEELPDLDVSIRGAVSIARRVQDPLAESVKIDPKSIGVGQYQHDVNQKELAEKLDDVVEDVVNYVGVELNTASPAILEHVAGISKSVAKNIGAYKEENGGFKNRKELLKVKRLGPATYEQCVGFIRVADSKNPLDNTPVHPESYPVAKAIIEELGFKVEDLNDKDALNMLQIKLPLVDVEKMAQKLEAGVPTVRDIIDALKKPGRDPREDLPAPMTRKHIMTLDEIKVGTVVKGTVNNVVDFGAFVDIGIKTNGLLHISKLCKRGQHPSEVVAVGDVIDVEIVNVDVKRNRIGLGLKR